MPPPSGNHKASHLSFFIRAGQEVGSINIPPWKTDENLALKKEKPLNDLKNSQFIIVKPCDNCICIMNTDYLTKIHALSRWQYIQTTNPQPSKRNGSWCLHSRALYAFPAHDRHGHNGISTASQEYPHTTFLWTSKNTQAKLPSPPCYFRMRWCNWPSLILYDRLYPAST